MKKFKVCMAAVAAFCIIVFTYAHVCACELELGEFYPKLVVVQHIETMQDYDIISCQDKHGDMWVFYSDIGDYDVGDILNLLMWNNNPDIYKHEIIDVYWEGYTKNMHQFMYVTDWRE